MLDKIILGLLTNKKFTAYDIRKAMEISVNHFYSNSLGSINPALKKLKKKKYVNCKEVIENHRVKKYYEITKIGRAEYIKWQQEPINIGRIKDEVLVRLFFMGDSDVELRKKLITEYLSGISEIRNSLKQMKYDFMQKEIPKEYAHKAKYQLSTLEFGIDYYQFVYDWFNKLLKDENNGN